MTERKPAGVSFETWVDAQIREARERGEFENLPGHSKPLANIDGEQDDLWWVRQWLKRENVTFTPPALALRKAVEDMLGSVRRLRTEGAVRAIVDKLNTEIRDLNRKPPMDGPPSTLMVLDVDDVIERWRSQRAEIEATEPQPVDESAMQTPAPVPTRRRWFRR